MSRDYENLKVGDIVAITTGRSGFGVSYPYKIGHVTRVLKTQIAVNDGFKYSRRHGTRHGYGGDAWGRTPIIYAMSIEEIKAHNDKVEAQRHKKAIILTIHNMDWHNLDIDTLEKVLELVGPHEN